MILVLILNRERKCFSSLLLKCYVQVNCILIIYTDLASRFFSFVVLLTLA